MQATAKQKIISLTLLVAISLLLFLTGFYSWAWFSSILKSGDLGFSSGKLDDNVLEIAKIIHPEDSTQELDESMRKYSECTNMQIEHSSLPTKNGDSYSVTLDQMTLGYIDNVALLKPDNVAYFRLSVPKKNGNTVKLKLYYNIDENGNFVDMYKSIYDTDGETVLGQEKISTTDVLDDKTTKIIDAFQNAEFDGDVKDCFLKYSVCLSNTGYEATELSSLDFYGVDGALANEDFDTHYRLNKFDASSDSITLVNEDIDAAGEFYYVYIRVEPNLNVFGRSIEYISAIMPCYVYFKVNAYFEIYNGGQG